MDDLPVFGETQPLSAPEPEKNAGPATSSAAPGKEPNFKMDFAYTSEGYAFDKAGITVGLPSGTDAQTREALRDTPNFKSGMDTLSQRYIEVINQGLASLPFGEGLVETAHRDDAMWAQKVESPVGSLMGVSPKFKKKEGVKYTGESARNLIRSHMKLGTVFAVPLWHSGFWVTLRSPTESDLIELYRKITQDKITLGRSTYGLLFSNVSVYVNKILLDFVIDNLYETSLNIKDNEDIRSYIQLPDLSLLVWGLACAAWPNGFQYERACITDVDKCKHVVSEKLNLSKLLWTDTTSLTTRQVQHMTKRLRGSMETETLKVYQDDFVRGKQNKIELTDTLSFVIKQPTALEHVEAGYRWINGIEEGYGRALNQDENTRNDYLLSHAQASSMRQYAHYISSILVDEEEIDGKEEVENALIDLSSRDDLRDLFMKKIAQFLDSSLISFVGIPTYTCPACGGNQRHSHAEEEAIAAGVKAKPAYPELIPLDVAQTFFPLMVQTVLRVRER